MTLASRAGTEDLAGLVADDSRWGHIAHGKLLPLYEAPILNGNKEEVEKRVENMKPIDGKPLHYIVPGIFIQEEYADLELEPFSGIHDCRYSLYWQAMDKESYEDNMERLALAEKESLRVDSLTVDMITLGEQQPEADHQMKEAVSDKGYYENESIRTIHPNGYITFTLTTDTTSPLSLDLQILGDDMPVISIDGKEIEAEPSISLPDAKGFRHAAYRLPEDLGASAVVTLRPQSGKRVGGIHAVRLIKCE